MPKILLVEDDELNRDMLARRLTRRAYEVVTAPDGKAAIDLAESEIPDLILMDLNLPEIDGWEATRRLKSGDATRHIPVIALTAYAMTYDRESALQAGCEDFETKPVDFHQLLGKIDKWLTIPIE